MRVGSAKAGGRVIGELNDEWDRLIDDDPQAVAQWGQRHEALNGCQHLRQILPRVRRDPDSVLAALLAECRAGEQLAGRAVLQAMLGKLILMSRRVQGAGIDDFVAALWIRMATYPLLSRPRRVAANLALDTLKAVHRERLQMQPALAQLTAIPEPSGGEEDLTARRVITAGRQLGLINAETSDVMVSVFVDGLSGRQAAERFQTSPEMVRYRCSDGRRRLARHAAALADAA
jgi:DNA-directed RNA polymerase specialized sigma24 family protein